LNKLQHLQRAGVSIWLDDLSRDLLDDGVFARLIQDLAVTGATSNPTIFAKAIANSDRYDSQIRELVTAGTIDPQEIFFDLALEDVRRGADMLRAVYELSDGDDGFVSFECTPDLADDAEATVKQALEIRERVGVPNLLIKVGDTTSSTARRATTRSRAVAARTASTAAPARTSRFSSLGAARPQAAWVETEICPSKSIRHTSCRSGWGSGDRRPCSRPSSWSCSRSLGAMR
jgi:hypothetical protein